MNLENFNLLGITIALAALLAPVAASFLISRYQKIWARHKGNELLKRNPEDLRFMVKNILGNPQNLHLFFLLPIWAISIGAIRLYSQSEFSAGDTLFAETSLIGPMIGFFLIVKHFRSPQGRLLEQVSQVVFRKGSLAQGDAWLEAISVLDWQGQGYAPYQIHYKWGSWKASEGLARLVEGPLREKLPNGGKLFQQWQEASENLKRSIGEHGPRSPKALEELAVRHFFWRRILNGFEQGDILKEMKAVEAGAGSNQARMLDLLHHQRSLLQAYPKVICQSCRKKGKRVKLAHGSMVGCKCGADHDLIAVAEAGEGKQSSGREKSA